MKKLKAGIIGIRMGRSHLNAYVKNPNTEVYGICDINEKLLTEIQQEYNIPFASTDYRELLDKKEIDIISVVTPDFYHREHCTEALRFGKHVLCEKPLALDLEDCSKIVKAARNSTKQFMIGQLARFCPGFALTKEIIDSGEIGELFFVESEYAHDYRPSPGAGNWRKNPARPREPFIGGACHAVDLIRWIAGDPLNVFAYANHKCLSDWPVNDATIAIYKFENDIMGKIFCSIGCVRPATVRSVFYGTKGTIISDVDSSFIQLCSEKYFKKYFKTKGNYSFAQIPVEISSHNMSDEIDYLVQKILKNEKVEMNEIEGSKTVACCIGAVISAKKGSTVDIRRLYKEFM